MEAIDNEEGDPKETEFIQKNAGVGEESEVLQTMDTPSTATTQEFDIVPGFSFLFLPFFQVLIFPKQ